MESKRFIYFGMLIGGALGGYVPVLLWNATYFSFSTVFFNAIGAIIGIYIAFKLSR